MSLEDVGHWTRVRFYTSTCRKKGKGANGGNVFDREFERYRVNLGVFMYYGQGQ